MPRAYFNSLYKLADGAPLDRKILADLSWLRTFMASSPPSRVASITTREDEPLILYTDASGGPKHGLGAVLIDGRRISWTACSCPTKLLELFRRRKTQINLLEVCGVILGLWTFSARTLWGLSAGAARPSPTSTPWSPPAAASLGGTRRSPFSCGSLRNSTGRTPRAGARLQSGGIVWPPSLASGLSGHTSKIRGPAH